MLESMAVANNSVHSSSLITTKNSSIKFRSYVSATPVRAGVLPGDGRRVKLPKLKSKLKSSRMRVESAVSIGISSDLVEKTSDNLNLGFDVVSERELGEKGFLGMRKTKIVCTIGPACCSLEDLEKLAAEGMNVARLNMCHNSKEWHRDVIRNIQRLNGEKGFCVAVMIDTEGSQIHVVDHGSPSSVKAEV